jgi:hypothetical protein
LLQQRLNKVQGAKKVAVAPKIKQRANDQLFASRDKKDAMRRGATQS